MKVGVCSSARAAFRQSHRDSADKSGVTQEATSSSVNCPRMRHDSPAGNAVIGDVSHFIKNNSKAGCHGLIVKAGVMETKTVKYMFKRILENFNFPQQSITDAVQLVG